MTVSNNSRLGCRPCSASRSARSSAAGAASPAWTAVVAARQAMVVAGMATVVAGMATVEGMATVAGKENDTTKIFVNSTKQMILSQKEK